VPLLIVEHRETSGRRRRAADDVHNDVHSAETIVDGISDGRASFGRRDVSRNKLLAAPNAFRTRPGRGQNGRTSVA